MEQREISAFRRRANSFRYAYNGIVLLLRLEPNARIHLVATILVIIAGAIKGLHREQWAAIIIAIAMVWVAEALNTAIERLCNLVVGNEYSGPVKVIKDVSAAAVLLAAIASAAIGMVVFLT